MIDIYFCPQCFGLFEFERGKSVQFKNEFGVFIKVWEIGRLGVGFKLHDIYLIGEL